MIDLLKFEDIEEFIKTRKKLKVYYIFLNYKEKREYKNYIYSLNYKEYILDIIWCYFNEPKLSCDYVYEFQIESLYKMYLRNNKVFNK